MYQTNSYSIAQSESPEAEKTFCKYNWGDWRGSSKYDETSDTVYIQNCVWGMGYDCHEYKINKIMDQDGIKVYCDNKHKNIFINDNGFWHWENPGCDKQDILETREEIEKWATEAVAHSLQNYAFKYTCPTTQEQLLVIDKTDKIYVINRDKKTSRIFSSTDNPIIYPTDLNDKFSVNESACQSNNPKTYWREITAIALILILFGINFVKQLNRKE